MHKVVRSKGLLSEIIRLRKENEELKAELKYLKQNKLDSRLYSSFFENNTSIMLLVDQVSGAIIDANAAACKFYGYKKDEITNMNIARINMLPGDELIKEMQNATERNKNQFFFQHRLSNGEIRDVESRSGPIELKGKKYLYSIVYDITEKSKAEVMLKQSEEKFRQLFDKVNDALFFFRINENGLGGNFLEANAEACKRLGYSYEEMLQLSPEDIDMHKEDEFVELSNMLNQHEEITFETTHVSKDGRHIPVEIRRHVFDWLGQKSILAVARDITNRKRIEKDLKESLEKQKKIMEFLPDALFIVDSDIIIFANKYGASLLGYSSAVDLHGKKYMDIVHPKHREKSKKPLPIWTLKTGAHHYLNVRF